ncbi:MAG: T9SS type A sorting domain-containing protein [Chitinophagales bacterium]|nr:T9SS type A sorting domain-containing protein [Chitinophagales bacterium]
MGAELKIYSSTGSLVFVQKIYSENETISLQNIKTSGVYLVTLTGISSFASTSFILQK